MDIKGILEEHYENYILIVEPPSEPTGLKCTYNNIYTARGMIEYAREVFINIDNNGVEDGT